MICNKSYFDDIFRVLYVGLLVSFGKRSDTAGLVLWCFYHDKERRSVKKRGAVSQLFILS